MTGYEEIKPQQIFSADQKLANKQERLFWSSSPKFVAKMIHFTMFGPVIWMVLIYGVYRDTVQISILETAYVAATFVAVLVTLGHYTP